MSVVSMDGSGSGSNISGSVVIRLDAICGKFRISRLPARRSTMWSACTSMSSALPGTFSPTILRNLLRAQLGFDGVIITDDLEMGAVVERYSQADAPIAALQAGADLLLVCNDVENMHLTADVVLDGLNRGLLDPQDLVLSLNRVAKLRKTYLDPPHLADVATVATHFST